MIGHRLIVVADAHLGLAHSPDEEALLAFLDSVPALGDSLLLAGDIYDFWFTYRRTIPRQSVRVTAAIIHLARRMPVLMIGGNHDRWGDTFWATETGVRFDSRRLRFQVGNREVLAVHGDGIHKERSTAALLNHIIATPAAIAAFRLLPTSFGFWVADRLRHDPAFASAHPDVIDRAAERQARWAEQTLAAEPALGALIMGHTHREIAREVGHNRWYLNPGQWLVDHRYGVLDADSARLAIFS